MISEVKKSFCKSRHHHPSKAQAAYCNKLRERTAAGEIMGYELYPSVALFVDGVFWKKWEIDFLVHENDTSHSYHESKEWSTPDDNFRLKRDIFLMNNPHEKLYVNGRLYTGRPNREWVSRVLKNITKNKKAARVRQRMRRARISAVVGVWPK